MTSDKAMKARMARRRSRAKAPRALGVPPRIPMNRYPMNVIPVGAPFRFQTLPIVALLGIIGLVAIFVFFANYEQLRTQGLTLSLDAWDILKMYTSAYGTVLAILALKLIVGGPLAFIIGKIYIWLDRPTSGSKKDLSYKLSD